MSLELKRSGSNGIKSEGMVKKESGDSFGRGGGGGGGGNNGGSAGGGGGSSSSSSKTTTPSNNLRETSPPPPTTFRDIPLYSSALKDDFKYHLMKLASFTKVDPSDPKQFPWPVKLNRKWPPRLKDELPMQGDPVMDAYGKPTLIPPIPRKEGTEPTNTSGLVPSEARKKIPLLWPGPNDSPEEVEELLARLEVPK